MIELITGSDNDYYMSERTGYCQIDEEIPLVYIVEVIEGSQLGQDGFNVSAGVMPGTLDDEDKILDEIFEHGFVPINLNSINPDSIPFKKHGMEWIVQDDEIDKALEMAMERAAPVFGLIGFFLDVPVNRIGQTGWDKIQEWLGKTTFHEWLKEAYP